MPAGVEVDRTVMVDPAIAADLAKKEEAPDTIAGYELQERIGAGGYGEVWSAIGPGNLPKAVKILHGRYDESMADTELKSLQLMRELRHPFLLNVERIEVVGTKLVIVTELAEGSLEDRFEQCKEQKFKGIPRVELLKYMHDAADALDYMYDHHGLQHLDIKPGNLLFQGAHLKVADFGLIKNLNKVDVSVITGFTPLYAAPELFDGHPTRSSDQYSLAIVYQTMLTGIPPFSGRTTAQLTAQQISSKPDLSPLSPSDQSTVARALSKNSKARFPSCAEFIDRLTKQRTVKSRSAVSQPELESPASSKPRNEFVRSPPTIVVSKPKATALAPVKVGDSVSFRPTLFVGIGGLGGEVLRRLSRRFSSGVRHGKPLPALPLLYIDTDLPTVAEDGDEFTLKPDQTLAIQLRDRNYYRAASGNLLEWLSRRWLFNIPRSQQVEGLRPLGRLAFVDHQRRIRERIQEALSEATTPEALEQTGESLGVTFTNQQPEVVLVASICGGTGSGAVLDTAYMVRDIFEKLNFDQANVVGLLLHATDRRDEVAKLQKASAVACLKELEHFSIPQAGYPGSPACQLRKSEKPPFDHTYLVHLGNNLREFDFPTETDKVAEYLYRGAITPAREFFEKCRRQQEDPLTLEPGTVHLRTFGVATLDELADNTTHFKAKGLCLTLLQKCIQSLDGDGRRAVARSVRKRTGELLIKLQLDTDRLSTKAVSISEGTVGKQVEVFFHNKLNEFFQQLPDSNSRVQPIFNAIEEIFATSSVDELPDEHPVKILNSLRGPLETSGREAAETLRSSILSTSDDSGLCLEEACEALSDIVCHLGKIKVALTQLGVKIEGDLKALLVDPSEDTGDDKKQAGANQVNFDRGEQRERCLRYAALRFFRTVLGLLVDGVAQVESSMKSTVLETRTRLGELESLFRQQDSFSSSDALDDPDLIRKFDEWFFSDHFVQPGDFTIQPGSSNRMFEILRKAAIAFMLQDPPSTTDPASDDLSAPNLTLAELITPRLSGVGGGRRVLAMLPKSTTFAKWKENLKSSCGDCITQLPDPEAEHFLCCEVGGVELESAKALVSESNPSITEMATRIHTRTDIDWQGWSSSS